MTSRTTPPAGSAQPANTAQPASAPKLGLKDPATRRALPALPAMLEAVETRDVGFEGIFFFGVTTTGIFCRPGCSARTPKRDHIVFFPSAEEAMVAGFRACRRCHPLEPRGATPDWIRPLLESIESDPLRRLRDQDLRDRGLTPERVRRWFQMHHGMTFHAYQRARRLGAALGRLSEGDDLLHTAFEHGFESASGFAEALRKLVGMPPGQARSQLRIMVERIPTPLGPMVAAATDEGLQLVEFANRRMLETQFKRVARRLPAAWVPGTNALLGRLKEELAEYFDGRRKEFTVPCHAFGSPFQEQVWRELERIPYGETRSYAELAESIDNPQAIRAVGRANGENRFAILIPCHRVIGSNGSLTGYGGGIWRKQRLLELEGAVAAVRPESETLLPNEEPESIDSPEPVPPEVPTPASAPVRS